MCPARSTAREKGAFFSRDKRGRYSITELAFHGIRTFRQNIRTFRQKKRKA